MTQPITDCLQRQSRRSTASNTRLMNYDLNIDKALLRKLSNTDRESPVEYMQTGGGLRMFCQPAYYELLKMSITKAIETPNIIGPGLKILQTVNQSKNGQNVTESYRVLNSEERLYCINLYNTDSTLLVNGKKVHIFRDTHIHNINGYIGKNLDQNMTLQTLNQDLKDTIQKWFKNNNPDRINNGSNCTRCSAPVNEKNSITCSECPNTTHFKCVKNTGHGQKYKAPILKELKKDQHISLLSMQRRRPHAHRWGTR